MATSDDLNSLKRRLRRLEALVAVLFLSGETDELEFNERFLYNIFRITEDNDDMFDDMFFELRQLLRSRNRSKNSSEQKQEGRLEQRLNAFEGQLQDIQSSNFELRRNFISSNLLSEQSEELRHTIEEISSKQEQLQIDVHEYLAFQSLGLDLADVPLPRFVPVRIYLSISNPEQVAHISNAVQEMLGAFGFTISDDFPAQLGSWWKKWIVKTKDVVTQTEVVNRLEKIERAVDLKGLHQPQSQINKNEADAIATLVKAIENVPNAAISAGSILLVKITDKSGSNCLQIRTLTPREMIFLEKHPDIIKSPPIIFEKLAEFNGKEEQKFLLQTDSK